MLIFYHKITKSTAIIVIFCMFSFLNQNFIKYLLLIPLYSGYYKNMFFYRTYFTRRTTMRFESAIKFLLRFLLKPLSFIPALMMMYIIFSFSAQDGTTSSNLSYKVTYKAVSAADRVLDLELTDRQISRCIRKIHYYVRKLAHFTEYFLLAVSVSFPLYVYGIRGIWLVITGGILCVGFASLDEIHQLFVRERGASVRDVVIDSCGSLIGILFVRLFGYIGRKTIFEPLSRR